MVLVKNECIIMKVELSFRCADVEERKGKLTSGQQKGEKQQRFILTARIAEIMI